MVESDGNSSKPHRACDTCHHARFAGPLQTGEPPGPGARLANKNLRSKTLYWAAGYSGDRILPAWHSAAGTYRTGRLQPAERPLATCRSSRQRPAYSALTPS